METDYLVVGAGASGLAFADSLVTEADVDVTLIDRRTAPGGHWLDAYSFVCLHTPSAYYGVNSLPLGEDRVDRIGENAGYYERATGGEVRDYFVDAAARLAATGRVRFLLEHAYEGRDAAGERVRDLSTGAVDRVTVRRKLVDARYLEASVPATHTPTFGVADAARVIAINDLPASADVTTSYTVLGSGKTAVDACMWLLDNEVSPERIRWIRPREAWFHDRAHFQPLKQVGAIMHGIALDAEAAAQANNLDDLFQRLEESGRLVRIDPSQPAVMYRTTMLSARELHALRQIANVVRLGRVRRIEADRIVLERGEVATGPAVLHVDCTARGLRDAPATPIFRSRQIVLQQVRHGSPTFNAALTGFIEAHRDNDSDRNRLCPPNPYPNRTADWPAMMSRTWQAERRWLGEPDLATWMSESRLNLLRALPEHLAEPAVHAAVNRYLTHVGSATERLRSGYAQMPASAS
jgi:hypothetical protein